MMKSFTQYLVEEESVVYFTFGRMNPPTIGHGKLLDALAKKAGRNPYKVYLSQSNNNKKDPVPYANKVKHVRKMFPKHGRSIVINKKVVTPFYALSDLYDQGFRQVVMVAGSDRVNEYEARLNKYNGKKGPHGFYNFKGGIKIVNAGARDPDAEGAEGASGTKQRKYAADNNFTGFSQDADTYPYNPNGSPDGITGLCNEDGRITIMMPHPERVFRAAQLSWCPSEWQTDSGWMRLFRNARVWLE